MAYSDVALLSADNDFLLRTTACCATEGMDDPGEWTRDHQWDMAAVPTFGDKYAYAIATGIVRPGNDQSVIADAEILAAVQSIVAAVAPADDDTGA